MSSFQWKFRAVASVAALLLLAGAMSCKGFFVNPTLTGITVTCPNAASCGSSTSPNIAANGTAKLVATGNYDDGSSKTLTGSVNWSSGDDTQITVNNTNDKGRITAVVASTASPVTISAETTDGTNTGSVSVTVGQTANVVTCTLGCSGNTVSIGTVTSVTFSATTSSTWSSSDTTIMSVSGNGATATGTVGTNTGTVTITATPTASGFATGSIQITVTN